MAPRRPPDDERNELVLQELEHLREGLARLEKAVLDQGARLDTVRVAELAAIRSNLADVDARLTAKLAAHDADLKLMRYQVGRSAATWSLIGGGVTSAVVGAVMAMLMHRGG